MSSRGRPTGPTLFLSAEDAEDELHFRTATIAEHIGAPLAPVLAHLHFMPLAGKDAVLGAVNNRTGRAGCRGVIVESNSASVNVVAPAITRSASSRE